MIYARSVAVVVGGSGEFITFCRLDESKSVDAGRARFVRFGQVVT